jgi:hypothetical protein
MYFFTPVYDLLRKVTPFFPCQMAAMILPLPSGRGMLQTRALPSEKQQWDKNTTK